MGLLRAPQVERLQDEKRRLEESLRQPGILDTGAIRRQIGRIETQLERQSPRKLEGLELDRVVREEKELRAKLTDEMLTQEEMRRNPPGAVDRNVRYYRRNKGAILRWKDLRVQLAAQEGDPGGDVANLEQYRPHSRPGALNLQNAQIPQTVTRSFPSAAFKEGHDRIDWDGSGSALEKRIAELEAQIASLESSNGGEKPKRKKPTRKGRKLNLSPEERQRRSEHGRQLAAAQKAKRDAAAQAGVEE